METRLEQVSEDQTIWRSNQKECIIKIPEGRQTVHICGAMRQTLNLKTGERQQGMNTHKDLRSRLLSIYNTLHGHFGHRSWWPAGTPFEVCVGAILTQNTSWKNVVKAIDNLKSSNSLDCSTLYSMPHDELAGIIRPAGYYNIKAKRLKNFVSLLQENYDGSLDRLFQTATPKTPVSAVSNERAPDDSAQPRTRCNPTNAGMYELRKKLLTVNGVGKETADSMILYAAELPIFVIDLYTMRLLSRHGIITENTHYDDVQALFQNNLVHETDLFKDYHAQIVAVGNRFCSKKPKCEECPLKKDLAG